MKSSYYDILDKYHRGFCGEGDSIAFEYENVIAMYIYKS